MQRLDLRPILVLLAGCLLAGPAAAAHLFFTGTFGNSGATGNTSGKTQFFNVSGSDTDISPSYGGTLGLSFALDEALPQVKSFELPSWTVRTELEYQMGRDYQFRSDGANKNSFFTNADAWSLVPNLALEVPLRTPISWLFGRIPVLEPMSIYGNAGIGAAMVKMNVTDNVSKGEANQLNFAWQAGVGLAYELTDMTTFQFGWRYVSLGQTDSTLKFGPGAKAGSYSLDLTSQEFIAGLRINFYTAPLKDMNPKYWRRPRVHMPAWLPSWLGGPSHEKDGEDKGDADNL